MERFITILREGGAAVDILEELNIYLRRLEHVLTASCLTSFSSECRYVSAQWRTNCSREFPSKSNDPNVRRPKTIVWESGGSRLGGFGAILCSGVPGWRKGCCMRMSDRIPRRPSDIFFLREGMLQDNSLSAAVTAGDKPMTK